MASNSPHASLSRRSFIMLDFYRGLFAFVVLLYHYGFIFGIPAAVTFLIASPLVNIFFVMSGVIFQHCYTNSIIEGREGAWAFTVKRFSRLWPSIFASTLAVFLVMYFGQKKWGLVGPYGPHLWSWFCQILIMGGFIRISTYNHYFYNSATWSLTVEVFCYAAFFISTAFLPKKMTTRGLHHWFWILASLAFSLIIDFLGHKSIPDFYRNLIFGLGQFHAGCQMAYWNPQLVSGFDAFLTTLFTFLARCFPSLFSSPELGYHKIADSGADCDDFDSETADGAGRSSNSIDDAKSRNDDFCDHFSPTKSPPSPSSSHSSPYNQSSPRSPTTLTESTHLIKLVRTILCTVGEVVILFLINHDMQWTGQRSGVFSLVFWLYIPLFTLLATLHADEVYLPWMRTVATVLGEMSLSVYLWHMFIREFVVFIFSPKEDSPVFYLYYIFGCIVTGPFGYAVYWYFEVPVQDWLRQTLLANSRSLASSDKKSHCSSKSLNMKPSKGSKMDCDVPSALADVEMADIYIIEGEYPTSIHGLG